MKTNSKFTRAYIRRMGNVGGGRLNIIEESKSTNQITGFSSAISRIAEWDRQ